MSDKTTKKRHSSMIWRPRLSEFLKTEREKNAQVPLKSCPQFQKVIEAQTPKKVPDLAYLVRMLNLFFQTNPKYRLTPAKIRRLLALWILARLEHTTDQEGFKQKISEDAITSGRKDKEGAHDRLDTYGLTVQQQVESALLPIIDGGMPTVDPRETLEPLGRLPTLAEFPRHFHPLTVVVGDYVGGENHIPKHFGELFRQRQSLINLHYLLRLNLPPDTEVISDRLLLDLTDDYERAEEVLGHSHLLVIGSPLVNSVSRHVIRNKKLVFNFVFDRETYRLGENFYDDIKKKRMFDRPSAVGIFYKMMETQGDINVLSPEFTGQGISKEDREKIKQEVLEIRRLVNKDNATSHDVYEYFRPAHYFSPFESKLQHCTGDPSTEFAVISLGENMWSSLLRKKNPQHPRYALLAVSGENKVSTAIALKALSQKYKDDFRNRPFGGVLKIELSDLKGPKLVTESRFAWLVKQYETDELLSRINDLVRSLDEDPDALTPLFDSAEEVRAYEDIVKQYLEGNVLGSYVDNESPLQ